MDKIRLLSLIVISAVILTTAFFFQAFGSTGSAKENNAPMITRGEYPLNEPHQSIPNVGAPENSSPSSDTGGPQSFGPTLKNCYSTEYHAATDCDRLASAPYFIPVTVNPSSGLTTKNCYSAEYHAATDCDRLASAPYLIPVSVNPSSGLTTKNCYSADYHAATDCDRLASAPYFIPVTGNSSSGPTTKNCYSADYHAATDCDRLASEIAFP